MYLKWFLVSGLLDFSKFIPLPSQHSALVSPSGFLSPTPAPVPLALCHWLRTETWLGQKGTKFDLAGFTYHCFSHPFLASPTPSLFTSFIWSFIHWKKTFTWVPTKQGKTIGVWRKHIHKYDANSRGHTLDVCGDSQPADVFYLSITILKVVVVVVVLM